MASLATNVLDISSLEEWEDALSKAQSTLVVTFFWAEFHEPSKRGGQMDMVFTALAGKYASKVNFLKVDAEKVPEVTGKYPVASVPTFVFIRNGATLGKVEGANPPELMKRVQLLSSQSNQPVVKKAASEEEKKKALNSRIARLIASAPVMVFMKGTPDEPKCKFSRKAMEILKEQNIPFGSFNILNDPDVRAGIKVYSNWPTFPQFYKNTELMGGLDIIKEMLEDDGDLESLRVSPEATAPKEETINDRLAKLIATDKCMLFMKGSPGNEKCGFSRTIVGILQENGVKFSSFDILTDIKVRAGLKIYSNWPTFPQLYVDSELIGGLDIVRELAEDGGLNGELGLE